MLNHSVADPYHLPESGSVSKVGLDTDPCPYQVIRIQQKPLKTVNKSQIRTEILCVIDLICMIINRKVIVQ